MQRFRETNRGFWSEEYFSSFELFDIYPWMKTIERPIRKRPSREMTGLPYLVRRGYEKSLIALCKAKASKARSVLYIIPFEYKIDDTVTLGAVSECNHALMRNVPVFIYTPRKQVVRIGSINDIFEQNSLKAPQYWLEREPTLRLEPVHIE